MNETTKSRINVKYILLLFIAVFASTIFHEYAHWSIGEILGNEMNATLNGTNPVAGEYINEWNRKYVTLAGPLFTVLQAILFYFLITKYRKIELYPFLLFPFVMRFFAGLANFLGANDEGRLGLSLGIGLFTLSILVCSFLLFLVYKKSKEMEIGMKFNIISFLLCSLFLLLLVFIDAKLKIKLA